MDTIHFAEENPQAIPQTERVEAKEIKKEKMEGGDVITFFDEAETEGETTKANILEHLQRSDIDEQAKSELTEQQKETEEAMQELAGLKQEFQGRKISSEFSIQELPTLKPDQERAVARYIDLVGLEKLSSEDADFRSEFLFDDKLAKYGEDAKDVLKNLGSRYIEKISQVANEKKKTDPSVKIFDVLEKGAVQSGLLNKKLQQFSPETADRLSEFTFKTAVESLKDLPAAELAKRLGGGWQNGNRVMINAALADVNSRLALGEDLPEPLEKSFVEILQLLEKSDDAAIQMRTEELQAIEESGMTDESFWREKNNKEKPPDTFLTDWPLNDREMISNNSRVMDQLAEEKVVGDTRVQKIYEAYEKLGKKYSFTPPSRREYPQMKSEDTISF